MLLIFSFKLESSSQPCFRGQTSFTLFAVVATFINISAKQNTLMTHLYSQREYAYLISEHMHWLGAASIVSADFPGTALLI